MGGIASAGGFKGRVHSKLRQTNVNGVERNVGVGDVAEEQFGADGDEFNRVGYKEDSFCCG